MKSTEKVNPTNRSAGFSRAIEATSNTLSRLIDTSARVTAQAAAGAGWFPHVIGDSLIAFLEQSSRFLEPVYVGDTVYPELVITRLEPGRTTGVVVLRATVHNQARELVMEGEHKYLLRRKPAA